MHRADDNDDDLFAPALAGVTGELAAAGSRPWRLGSQLYVGFFGGALAATAIAWLNAERLGLKPRDRWPIVAAGALGLVVTVAAAAIYGSSATMTLRLFLNAGGIGTAAAQRRTQSAADRRYGFRHGEEGYDSLWGPGFAAVIGLGLLELFILIGVASA